MKLVTALLLLLVSTAAFSQQEPEYSRDWSSIEIVLSIAILVFALAVLGVEAFIIQKAQKVWAPQSIV